MKRGCARQSKGAHNTRLIVPTLLETPWSPLNPCSLTQPSSACCHLRRFHSCHGYSWLALLPPWNHIIEASHLQSTPSPPTHLHRSKNCAQWDSLRTHMCARHVMFMSFAYNHGILSCVNTGGHSFVFKSFLNLFVYCNQSVILEHSCINSKNLRNHSC